MQRMLAEVKGRVDAVLALNDKGLPGIVACLDALLPPLIAVACAQRLPPSPLI